MRNTKLIQVLKTFSNIEMKHIGLMTISPYFNRKKEVTDLFEIVRQHHPKFESDKLDRKTIYGQLFPKEKHDDQRLRDLIKSLDKLTEEILIRSKSDAVNENSLNLVRAYFERGQLDIGLKACERYLKLMDAEKGRDKHHFQLKSSLVEMRNWILFRMRDGYGMEMAKAQMSLELDIVGQKSTAFILDVHDSYHILKSAKSVFGFDFDEDHFASMFQAFLGETQKLPIEARVALSLFTLNHKEEVADFEATKKLLLNEHHRLNEELIEMLLMNLQNFCQRRADEGKDRFLNERFQLFDWETKHGYVVESIGRKLKSQHFLGAVSTALRVGELSWVDTFIEEYGGRLTGEHSNDILSFCKAMQAFYLKDYNRCRALLVNLNYGTYNHKLQMRFLELRLYYELKDFELVESKIDSTRHFLSDTKYIPKHRMPLYLNFIRFLQQLVALATGDNKPTLSNLKKDISDSIQVDHRDWLIEKQGELQ